MKKIVYGIEINTADAETSIKRIDERINVLGNDASSSQREVNSLRRELTELGQTRVDQTENVQSVQSLRRAYKELILEIQNTEQGTERFRQLAAEAGDLKNRLDDVSNSVTNLSGSPFQNLNRSFTSLIGNIRGANFPAVSRNLGDIGTSLTGAAANILGLNSGLSKSAIALRGFRAALIGTGIGAVVILVTTLISNFEELSEAGGFVGRVFTGIANIVDGVQRAFLGLSDAIGLTENALDKYNNKKLEEKFAAQLEKEKEIVEETTKLVRDYIKELENLGDPTLVKLFSDIKNAEDATTKLGQALDILRKKEEKFKDETVKIRSEIEKKNLQLQKTQELLAEPSPRTDLDQFVSLLSKATQLSNEIKKLNDDLVKTESEGLGQVRKQIEELEQAQIKLPKLFQAKFIDSGIEALLNEIDDKFKRYRLFILDRQSKNEITQEQANSALLALELEYYQERLAETERFLQSLREQGADETLLYKNLIDEQLKLKTAEIALIKDKNDRIAAEEKRLNDELDKIFELRPESTQFDPNLSRKEDIESANRVFEAFQKQINFQKEITNSKIQDLAFDLQAADQRVQILEDFGLKDFEIYQDALNNKLIAEKKFQDELDKIRDERLKKEEERLDKEKQARDLLVDQSVAALANATFQIQGILNDRYNYELQLAGDNQQKINDIQKKQFETNKSFSILSTIINTAQAIMSIWANTPNPIAAGILSGVVAGIGAAQVGIIASQQFQPNAPSTSSFTPNTQGSLSMADLTNYSPNVNFAQAGSGANIQTVGGGTPQSLQFTGSISVSEITNTQQLVNVYETNSLLEGFG